MRIGQGGARGMENAEAKTERELDNEIEYWSEQTKLDDEVRGVYKKCNILSELEMQTNWPNYGKCSAWCLIRVELEIMGEEWYVGEYRGWMTWDLQRLKLDERLTAEQRDRVEIS